MNSSKYELKLKLIMKKKTFKGSCLARGQETSALCSPCFRKSVELLTLQAQKGGESWAW